MTPACAPLEGLDLAVFLIGGFVALLLTFCAGAGWAKTLHVADPDTLERVMHPQPDRDQQVRTVEQAILHSEQYVDRRPDESFVIWRARAVVEALHRCPACRYETVPTRFDGPQTFLVEPCEVHDVAS